MRIKTTTPLAAGDSLTVKTLANQIQSSHALFDIRQHEHNQYTPGHPQDLITHPINYLRPVLHMQDPALDSAIRLYLHFVDHALPIFHSLLHCMPTLASRKDESDVKEWTFPEPLITLTAEQKAITWEYMGRLGREIEWKEASREEMNKGGKKMVPEGECTLRPDRPLQSRGLLGFGSTITTSRKLVQHVEASARTGDSRKHQWCSFDLATTWLHELSHAVEHAVLPGVEWNDVFLGPGAKTSETGFEVEGRVFGGRFNTRNGNVGLPRADTGEVWMREWPDLMTIHEYWNDDNRLIARLPATELERLWVKQWRIDWRFVEKMFEDQFWQKHLKARLRQGMLRPERRADLHILRKTSLTVAEKEKARQESLANGYVAREIDDYLAEVNVRPN
ncbi:hypothetical protein TI39_contig403g00005 [Zymoseptoria brevis]|uniref:Uncharacterized protein n=1 Tax=Zymoseptoria brevis TaxID=1047168 RepID=A0A0F4GMX6_9PEZI|nr:hypothetical protein TI39_contig403g00005 [Zymoseptoria brevis]